MANAANAKLNTVTIEQLKTDRLPTKKSDAISIKDRRRIIDCIYMAG